jgi:hypothetical protein
MLEPGVRAHSAPEWADRRAWDAVPRAVAQARRRGSARRVCAIVCILEPNDKPAIWKQFADAARPHFHYGRTKELINRWIAFARVARYEIEDVKMVEYVLDRDTLFL